MILTIIWIILVVIATTLIIITIASEKEHEVLLGISIIIFVAAGIFGMILLGLSINGSSDSTYDSFKYDYNSLTAQLESISEKGNKDDIDIDVLFKNVIEYNKDVKKTKSRVNSKAYNWFYTKKRDRIEELKTIDLSKYIIGGSYA